MKDLLKMSRNNNKVSKNRRILQSIIMKIKQAIKMKIINAINKKSYQQN